MTKKINVMILDSNPEELMPLICFLEDDYTASVAPEHRDYLAFGQACKPDIILVDDMISDPNCYDVCRGIKSSKSMCDVPVVLMSDLHKDELEKEIDYLSVEDYICKPISKNELLEKIQTLIAFGGA